jgi:GTP-binding protein HflX
MLVLDASAPEPMRNFEIVRSTLEEIGAGEVPRIAVLNKIDRAAEESVFVAAGLSSLGESVARISARTGGGLDELVDLTFGRLEDLGSEDRKGD